ncbi:MAG: ATP-binding protein [Bacteroidales bacterium]|nr:ATP-binding protein [Bacteroidales bacterium]
MIQKITIKNFMSFKDEVTFSFEASKDEFAEDYQVVKVNDNTRLLRFAIVYGYNASGKSNLLKSFQFLLKFCFQGPKDSDDGTKIEPFELDLVSINEPTVFDLVFFVDKVRYRYQLTLDKIQVLLEKLSYYETTQPIKLFERVYENNSLILTFGSDIKISKTIKELIEGQCLKNMSLFEALPKVNANMPLIDSARVYLKTMMKNFVTPKNNLINEALMNLPNNQALSTYLLDFIHNADFNITNIKTKVHKRTVPDVWRNLFIKEDSIPDFIKKNFLSNNVLMEEVETLMEHTVENERGVENYTMSLDKESEGTLRMLGVESRLFDIIKGNEFLAIDEIETSLHPKLLEKILFEFLKQEDTQSQMIVTTHNDGLLDLIGDLIRKDSVWFTEKKKSGATDLYKLTDFRGLNRISSIREAYRLKRFGATMN